MEELILNINDNNLLEDNIKAFALLSKQDKLIFLEKFKALRTESAGLFLNRLYVEEKDKNILKAIKKLLFRLKTLGVKVEEPEARGEPVLKKIEEKRMYRGLMSNYDGEGTRLVVVAFEVKKNSFILLHAMIDLTHGLMELATAPVDRNGIEALVVEYCKRTPKPFTVIEVAPRFAGWLIEEGSNLSGKYTEEVREIKPFLSRLPGPVQKPSDIYSLTVPEDTDALPLERIASKEIFESLTLPWDNLDEDKKQFNDIGGGSSIVLPPYMIQEKRRDFVKNLVQGDTLKSKLPLITRLMEDYAYLLHNLGDFGAYKGLITMLRDPEGPASMLSFLVNKALVHEEKQEQPGLIMNPYGQVRS